MLHTIYILITLEN